MFVIRLNVYCDFPTCQCELRRLPFNIPIPAMKPNIFFNSELDSPEKWRAALATHFGDFTFSVAGDCENVENVNIAIVWTIPDGGLERFVNLRAILSLGAGVNQLDPARLPAHVPLARLV